MFNQTADPGVLRPKELEAVYAISRAVARSVNVASALDEITHLTRPVFIFDSVMLYRLSDSSSIEPAYARVIGRGLASDGELAWGESTANEVFRSKQTVLRHEEGEGWQEDRLMQRYFLGLPLSMSDQLLGALVFGRFGGPPYTPDQTHLAEFIAAHASQLLGREKLVGRIASLEAERRLERLQQDFIATVSHELNTPLGFIKGYATTLLREDTTWDEATRREFLLVIDEEADRLRELIDNLLDSSRLQSGTLQMHFQPVRLDALLRDASVRVSSNNENLVVRLDIKKSDLRCQADPTRLAQVLENLLSNAIKYAPGSEVKLTLDVVDSQAQISVSDKGPGIAPEHLENLFKRFYRVPEYSAKARGTGLGLFICRQIIRAHGGDITVESSLGEGTIFHIFLPCVQSTADTTTPMEEIPS
ncbi:MAG: GAF domain-containing protein [Chloroflexota bacterium]|nr:MAG: GAF domain-containing protein [Chloroflexota bacterium]